DGCPPVSFAGPAQIPRSFLRSFSLWARHPAETSAELNVRLGAAEFFPGASRQVRRVRKRRRCEGGAERLRVESRVHDTNLRSVGEQNRCQVGPTILFECPAQIPRSFLRSFSLWARHPAETSAELNVRLGAAEFFPGASRQVRRVRKRRREGNARFPTRRSSDLESGTRYKPAI